MKLIILNALEVAFYNLAPKEKPRARVNLDKALSQLVSSAIEDKGVVNIFDFAGG